MRICERTPGVFPYEWTDSFEKFELTHLPAQADFYSSLSEEHVSDTDYAFAQTIWSEFDMHTFQDYHNLYLLLDVLQLADVFTSYRETCYEHYKLDPANFFTSPALSWHAMLLKTGASIELISDPDTHQFIEQNVRGGVAVASKRHVEANIPGTEEHNPDESPCALAYLDANNLYGFAMTQRLPVGEMEWMDEGRRREVFGKDFEKIPLLDDDSERGYILEVDLSYPESTHDAHMDFPLAPEKMGVHPSMLSAHQRATLATNLGVPLDTLDSRVQNPLPKLVPNLFDKTRYGVDYRLLKLYVRLGLVITKIHRALEFEQTYWLRDYINFNTEQRAVARNAFEKVLFYI